MNIMNCPLAFRYNITPVDWPELHTHVLASPMGSTETPHMDKIDCVA